MRLKLIKAGIVDYLFSRKPGFYNIIGGSLVGGSIGLLPNLTSGPIGTLTIMIVALFFSGIFLSDIAWQIETVVKLVEAKRERFSFQDLVHYEHELREKVSGRLFRDLAFSILLVIVAIVIVILMIN